MKKKKHDQNIVHCNYKIILACVFKCMIEIGFKYDDNNHFNKSINICMFLFVFFFVLNFASPVKFIQSIQKLYDFNPLPYDYHVSTSNLYQDQY